MLLTELNALSAEAARATFLRCCGSHRWAEAMAALRPYGNAAAVHEAAARAFGVCRQEDWLEAFAAHPELGDRQALAARFASTASWSSQEQSGVAQANDGVIAALLRGNRAYRQRFGFVFLLCATGKSAAAVLEQLEARLPRARDEELATAAQEQRKITALRLEKLLSCGADAAP